MHTLTLKHIYTDTTHIYTHTHSFHTHTHIYKYKCVLFIFIGIHGYRGAHVEVKGSFGRHFSFSTLCCLLFLVDCILAGLLASRRLQSLPPIVLWECWDYRCKLLHLVFCVWGSGMELRSSSLLPTSHLASLLPFVILWGKISLPARIALTVVSLHRLRVMWFLLCATPPSQMYFYILYFTMFVHSNSGVADFLF